MKFSSKMMNRFNFADRSGVIIDKCAMHGIWFDRDELRRIVEFIRSGGLTLARERETEELKRQRMRLEAERASLGTGVSASFSIGDDKSNHLLGGLAGLLLSFWE